MKVCDYEVDYTSGCFTCCENEVMDNDDEAHEGMTITCDDCGTELVLQGKDGKLMWRARK